MTAHTDIDSVLAAMTVEEKALLLGGASTWRTHAIARLGIPAIKVTDGPNGARGDAVLGSGDSSSVCIPSGSALGATWDSELIERLGEMLGRESRSKGAHVLLAPTINLQRHPLGGRNFECYSEDPLLSGKAAGAFIRGVQSQGVATTPKHFLGNDSEFERNTINTVVDDRTLRELLLVPFEVAIAEANPWGLMTAYNRLNGTHCSEHEWLLETVLRGDLGFDGFVVSDWFGMKSTAPSVIAGNDLEMPGPAAWLDHKLVDAMAAGEVSEEVVTRNARRILELAARTGAFDDPVIGEEQSIDLAEDRALCREAAAASVVLLKNDGLLPLDARSIGSLALIGPNAVDTQIMGGGSAQLRAHYNTNVELAMREHLGGETTLVTEPGCTIAKTVPAIPTHQLTGTSGQPGLTATFWNNQDFDSEPAVVRQLPETRFLLFGTTLKDVNPQSFSMRAEGTYTPNVSGEHTFSLIQVGQAQVWLNDELILDGVGPAPLPVGEAFFGMGSEEILVTRDLEAGVPATLRIDYTDRGAAILNAAVVGCAPPVPSNLIERAAEAAANADVAVVVVGTNPDWETEGNDRQVMTLPGDQDELLTAVINANPKTVVVLNTGSVVDVTSATAAPAVVNTWFGGQEMSNALVDILFGNAEPGGRLPTTYPAAIEDPPSHMSYPGENGEVRYGESVFLGYRGYLACGTRPAFAFGHGLSYTQFEMSDISAPTEATVLNDDDTLEVSVEVTNTGDRRGSEVIQLYVSEAAPRLARPPHELKAWQKVWLNPGESTTVTLELDRRSFAYWDPGLADGFDNGTGTGTDARGIWRGGAGQPSPGWTVDPGDFTILVGRASDDLPLSAAITLTSP